MSKLKVAKLPCQTHLGCCYWLPIHPPLPPSLWLIFWLKPHCIHCCYRIPPSRCYHSRRFTCRIRCPCATPYRCTSRPAAPFASLRPRFQRRCTYYIRYYIRSHAAALLHPPPRRCTAPSATAALAALHPLHSRCTRHPTDLPLPPRHYPAAPAAPAPTSPPPLPLPPRRWPAAPVAAHPPPHAAAPLHPSPPPLHPRSRSAVPAAAAPASHLPRCTRPRTACCTRRPAPLPLPPDRCTRSTRAPAPLPAAPTPRRCTHRLGIRPRARCCLAAPASAASAAPAPLHPLHLRRCTRPRCTRPAASLHPSRPAASAAPALLRRCTRPHCIRPRCAAAPLHPPHPRLCARCSHV
ncbi:hypothetical protein B0H14DRAFT_3894096, partial [Mycena olivaceomarginata]